jgi:thiosulfate/3-mercaptopyruvate sulfurtransferase
MNAMYSYSDLEVVMEDKVLLDPEDLAVRLKVGDVIPIDTRDPESFAAGHIPGAVNAHDIFTYLATSTPEGQRELQTKFTEVFGNAGLSGKELAVVYEQSMNTGFGQSCRGYYLL